MIIEMRETSCHAGTILAGILVGQVDSGDQKQSSIKLGYQTPPRYIPNLNAPSVYGIHLAVGFAVSVLLIELWMIVRGEITFPGAVSFSGSIGLLASFFVYFTAKLGGSFPSRRRVPAGKHFKRIAMTVGLLMPGILIFGVMGARVISPSHEFTLYLGLVLLAVFLFTPFTTVAILVSYSPDYFPTLHDGHQRDRQR